MIIDRDLARAFNKAVTNLDNFKDGKPNWFYVDYAVYLDVRRLTGFLFPSNYIEQFDYLANCYAD